MLKFNLITFNFFRFFQSGFNLDFFFKKLVEIFVKNFFIVTSLFFGEKFIIEYLTKKTIDNFVFTSNRYFNLFELFYSKFFVMILFLIFVFWTLFLFLFI